MKTVILIVVDFPKWLDFYHLNEMKQCEPFRFVAIISAEKASIVTPETIEKFDKVIFVNKAKQVSDSLLPLDLYALNSAVKDEIELNPDQANIILIGVDEAAVMHAAKLRDEFKLKGASYNDILPFRNKVVMKQRLRNHGIRTPKFIQINALDLSVSSEVLYQELVQALNLPFIVKPIDGAGSEATYKINNLEQFLEFYSLCSNATKFRSYEAEEYIQGTLYECDSVTYNKEIKFSEVCKLSYPCLEIVNEQIIAIMPCIDAGVSHFKLIS